MAIYYSVLGQVQPTSTAETDLYRPQGSAIVSTLAITNTSDYQSNASVYINTGSTLSDAINWVPINANIGTNIIYTVAYKNGLYFAASSNGVYSTSTDAVVWTTRSMPVGTNIIKGIAYGAGVYVAVAQSAAASSTDGITWVTRNIGLGGIANTVIFSNGLFIAAGSGPSIGNMKISTDGITWTPRFVPGTTITEILYENGIYIASAYQGVVYTSTDSITWSTRDTGIGTSDILAMGYGNGIFVVGARNRAVATSTDGITWTTRNPNLTTVGNINEISFGNNTYIIVADTGNISTSTDAVTWSLRTSNFGTSNINSISYNDGLFLAGGAGGTMRASFGGNYDASSSSNAILYNTPISPKSTVPLTIGIALENTNKISVQSSMPNTLTFNVFGSETI
jgi:hypothetical protein